MTPEKKMEWMLYSCTDICNTIKISRDRTCMTAQEFPSSLWRRHFNELLKEEVFTSQVDYSIATFYIEFRFLVATATVQRRLKKLVSTRVIFSTFNSCLRESDRLEWRRLCCWAGFA